jgi:hypothetical protein
MTGRRRTTRLRGDFYKADRLLVDAQAAAKGPRANAETAGPRIMNTWSTPVICITLATERAVLEARTCGHVPLSVCQPP